MNESNKYQEYIELLKANKNLILTGAPGTGKTFLAREIAKAMNAEYTLVQFHPSYDYTDFVEGLRPTPPDNNGHIGFERKDGVFKEFCKKANTSITHNIVISKSDSKIQSSQYDDNIIDKAMEWLKKQNGVTLESNRSNTKYTLIISDKIYVKIPNGREYYVNPNSIIKYLKAREYDTKHQTYEPSVGEFILNYCPLFQNKSNIISNEQNDLLRKTIQHKDILPPIEKNNKTTYIQNIYNENNNYLFIIDEINRGELSKIFGELFFCIDPGYRGRKGLVKTQYQNLITDESDPFYEGFYVPENVYIIGTMNDIDRSVESMDFAMRRRFAWKEVKANENTSMLDELGELKNEVIRKMNRLNTAIWNEETNEGIEGLSAAYHIGGAYFMKLKLYLEGDNKTEAYRKLWENHLRGVLFEYLRGSLNATENLSMLEKTFYSENE